MVETVTQEHWLAISRSVRDTGYRLAEIVATAPRPTARATRHWSVVETAAHVATVTYLNSVAMQPRAASYAVPGMDEILLTTTVDTVSALNEVMLRHLTERDPAAVAELVRTEVDQLLGAAERLGPDAVVQWAGDSRVPVSGLLAHTLNELTIHGRDIARATGEPWQIPPEDAATFLDLFLVGMIRHDYGHLLDTDKPAKKRRPIAVQFRSAYTPPATLVLDDGAVSIDDSSPRRVDVRVTFKPTALNLMMFGRISKLRAIITGGVVVGGRRPWLLPVFLRTVRVPS